MGVKWIKLCTDIFDDEKILLIEGMPEADAIIVIWFKLLCMAGKQNNSGVFMLNDKIAYTEEMLATIFRRPLNVVRLAIKTFESFGMVEVVEGAITIPNWCKHQNIEQLESRKEYMREYMKNYRNQKALPDVNSCKHLRKPNVNTLEKEIDKELKEKETSTNVLIKKKKSSDGQKDVQNEFFKAYPDVKIDNYSPSDYADIDFKVLKERFDNSEFLRTRRSFSWICSNYHKIESGAYEDFKSEREGTNDLMAMIDKVGAVFTAGG